MRAQLRPGLRVASDVGLWALALAWTIALCLLRPRPELQLLGIAVGVSVLRWGRRVTPRTQLAVGVLWAVIAIMRPHVDDTGLGRLYVEQTYHHQVLRALNHTPARGADISEVLHATDDVRAGDAQGWYAAWTALGDRNRARAATTRDRQSRGEALLRAHTYYLRGEFFLQPNDPQRPASFARNRRAFYEGLDTLGVAYERIRVPFEGHHLNAIYYPAPATPRAPLLVFCGGSDTTVEELYFFLVAAARDRGYSVLTFEGPGQGAVLREQRLTMRADWEKPTAAVLDTYLATHTRPQKIVMIGLSLGGYLAARAAAFDRRIDGVVAYDVFYDGRAVAQRGLPPIARGLRAIGFDGVVDAFGPVLARVDPATDAKLIVSGWMLGETDVTKIADALAEFQLASVAPRITQDVLLFAGEDDQFVPLEQVAQLQRALVHARSVVTKVYDPESGGAEHSQLGATTLWQADLFDWLDAKFGESNR